MRNLKRFLAMALTVLMVVGSFSAMSVSAFEDVTDYQEAIDVMAALGILKGTDEEADLFSPEENIARWQMALIITKMMTGKVDAAYVEANFNTSINSTLYTDLNEGQYMGATAYAANNGIVVGTSATTYEPEAEIMIQDVFTMVVRMLGYGSTAMNANYPWSFIDKAISLGLDAGLPADYANEKAATRGETAQILYNALTAVKADGSTLGYDFFGLEKATVIITGTKDGNMFTDAKAISKTADGVDYVAFNVLNADGSIAATTYYAPKSAFGIEGNANAYVGYPFVVRTVDGFATFMTCDAIEAVVVDQAAVVGAAASATDAQKKVVTIDGTAYTLVKTYSDFIADNNDEIILNAVGSYANIVDYGSYVMDKALNILGKDGNVLLEWHEIGNVNGAAFQNGTYLYKVAEGKYIVPNDAIWAQAATYVTGTTVNGFKAITNSYSEIEQYDAYSDTVLFDLDGDGDYERGIYTQYSFKKIADDTSIDGTKKASTLSFVTSDGEAKAFADYNGKYVLYAYNPVYKTVIIKAVYEVSNGLLTGVNAPAAKITFNRYGLDFINGSASILGETYTVGKANLKGATSVASEGYFKAAIGKNVTYVLDSDNVVLDVDNYANGPYYMVVATEQVVNYTTMGYHTILAYFNTATNKAATTQTLVTVNAVDNYWYGLGLINNAVAKDYTPLQRGDLLKATKDALGNYDTVKVATSDYTYHVECDEDCEDTCKNNISAMTIKINNGIVSATNSKFVPFAAKTSTVWLVKNRNAINTYLGIPANGTEIAVTGNVFVGTDFIYIDEGTYTAGNGTANDGWNATNTIVYIDDTAAITNVYDVVNGNNLFIQNTNSYSNAIDIYTGAIVNNLYTANGMSRLEKGKFYKVEAGYVVAEVPASEAISYGILLNADKEGKLDIDATADAAGATTVQAPVNYNYQFLALAAADVKAVKKAAAYTTKTATEAAIDAEYSVLPKLFLLNNTDVYAKDALAATNRDGSDTEEKALAALYANLNNAYSTTNDEQGIIVWKAANADINNPVFFAVDGAAIKVTYKQPDPIIPDPTTSVVPVEVTLVAADADLSFNKFTLTKVITDVKITDYANTTPVAVNWKTGLESVDEQAVKITATSAMGISSTDGVATYNITVKMGYTASAFIINANNEQVAVNDMAVKADNIAQTNTYTIKLAESDIANNEINVIFVIAKNAD